MFDAHTVELIRSAPPLEGLELEDLPKELTRAYSTIVSMRMRLRQMITADVFETELGDVIRRLETLALTQEAFVTATPERSNRVAAAFVAASAHQLRFSAERLVENAEEPSLLAVQAIAPEIAATIMFLVAGRAADAARMARNIRFGPTHSVEDDLRRSIVNLARGRLDDIVTAQRAPEAELTFGDEAATSLLWLEILRGVQALASRLLGNEDALAEPDPATLFGAVRELCVQPVTFDGTAQVLSVFPGPHHLASLLHSAANELAAAGLVNVEAPPSVPAGEWRNFLRRLAKRRPYLWPNHQEAIASGYLKENTSAVVSFPTGAGKSTLAELKIGAARIQERKVVYLAPTLALVDQVTSDLRKTFPEARTTLADELEPEDLTNIAVMTPERCLTLLGFSPVAFEDVGLLVFDECHLLHPRESAGRRNIDAMLCLLGFLQTVPTADVVLVSAMIKNSTDLAAWLKELTKRECLALSLSWKPTRQARGCVVYPSGRIAELQKFVAQTLKAAKTKSFPARKKEHLTASPFGMLSLLQTWKTRNTEDYVLLPLLGSPVRLGASQYARLTANRNEVAATIAATSADMGIKTLVFAAQPSWCASIEGTMEELMTPRAVSLTPSEREWFNLAVAELGGEEHSYCRPDALAASHHGLLLPIERQLNESMFRRDDGIHVLVATSTLAQGMNLPSHVVVIAGDDRFDATANKVMLLEAHELLNAAGRAGRAGEAAEGLVLLVPGKVISYDEEKNTITGHWFELQSIFSNSDQCLEIEDPLQPILDRIHSGAGALDADEAYFLRRLPFTMNEAGESPRRLLQKTFAAFKASQRGDAEWITTRIESAMRRREEVLGKQDVVSWEDELASSTGTLDAAQIRSIAERLEAVENLLGSVSEWIDWGFDWLEEEPGRLGMIAPPSRIISVLGNSVIGFENDPKKATKALKTIRGVMPLWLGGSPLKDLQPLLSPRKLEKCETAREWALNLAPELAYFFGLVVQVYRRQQQVSSGQEPLLPLAFATHGRCVRDGFDDPDKLALRQVLGALYPRVAVHNRFAEIERFIRPGGSYETMDDAARRIRRALRE